MSLIFHNTENGTNRLRSETQWKTTNIKALTHPLKIGTPMAFRTKRQRCAVYNESSIPSVELYLA